MAEIDIAIFGLVPVAVAVVGFESLICKSLKFITLSIAWTKHIVDYMICPISKVKRQVAGH
jgi:hypothetical protein